MKIQSLVLLVSTLFLFACSPSEDTASVQPTPESSDTNDTILEEQGVEVQSEQEAEYSESNSDLIPIPMSDSLENGRYFLTSQATENGIENIEYIRKGNDNISYAKMEIRCADNQIRKYSADNVDALQSADMGNWITPTPDWTDQDIVNFICN
jgi:hypothetical protein